MTSCDHCVQLLLDYIDAGNQVVELKRRRDPPSGLLARAMTEQAQDRQRWIRYQRNLGCDGHCPNAPTNCRGNFC
jgi:hypothetical protein